MNYSEQLRDPRWQRVRLEIMSRDNWQCKKCHKSNKTLNVHHKAYIKGRMAWEYDYTNLETLCEICHGKEHEPERVYATATPEQILEWKLTPIEEPPVITSINQQLASLTKELGNNPDEETETEIMKNIIFLQKTRKELLTK